MRKITEWGIEIAKFIRAIFGITANQNLIVANVAEEDKAQIEQIARDYGLIRDDVSKLRENSMSCVSFPNLSISDGRIRANFPSFIDELDRSDGEISCG